MKVELLNVLLALASTVISAIVSLYVARAESRTQIKKTKMYWEKQHKLTADSKMQSALSAAALCVHEDPLVYRDQALAYIAPLLCVYSGRLGDCIARLYSAITKREWEEAAALIPEAGELYTRHKNPILRLIDRKNSYKTKRET